MIWLALDRSDMTDCKIKQALQQELEYLTAEGLTVDSPKVQVWIAKAANHLRKEELLKGQKFVVNEKTYQLEKVFIH